MNAPLITAVAAVIGSLIGGTVSDERHTPVMSDKNIQAVHKCHDKGKLVAVTRDAKGEYVSCNRSWADWKKYIKKLKAKQHETIQSTEKQ
jgi:hypothetical protein